MTEFCAAGQQHRPIGLLAAIWHRVSPAQTVAVAHHHSAAATSLHNSTRLGLHTLSMSLRQLVNQGQALLRRAAAGEAAGGTLQRSAFSTLPDDLATAALKARFPARRPMPSASSAAAGEGAAAGVSPAAAAQQAAAKEVQVGASRSWC